MQNNQNLEHEAEPSMTFIYDEIKKIYNLKSNLNKRSSGCFFKYIFEQFKGENFKLLDF